MQPSTPSSLYNSPKLLFNKENMDLIRRSYAGQTLAASFSSDRQEGGGQFPPEKPGEMSDNYTTELPGLRSRSCKGENCLY